MGSRAPPGLHSGACKDERRREVTEQDDPYVYRGTRTLRNRLRIAKPSELDRVERSLVTDRIAEGVPKGKFDLAHLRAIHRHLFQDLYDWAGQLRTVEISKG